MPGILWTIGHSTRPVDEFIDLLRAHDVLQVIDVRTIPRSRHNPQFNSNCLATSLTLAGLVYGLSPELGGLRKPSKNSINTGWRNASFRGYADYMQTDAFWNALENLIHQSAARATAVMCAEAVPWRCHRSLIADAVSLRGWKVRHILSSRKVRQHVLTAFAVVDHGKVRYPAPVEQSPPELF
ncbi:hypothetical protein W02_18550 [Nitrospira sp. KM1]|uniref:DUF488 domain-containing protein n=1 Tax=Nitrospira sp. KM1 TaxID=1936990 RepID=UPI0013A7406E|nr:DUF488 domain-containing protein [Nitrospira sp. KM1]BCA54715.1 hypothetical protein W02_18550 [Nitrospira sp. KM1]